jgi:hypothetical protein
MDWDRLSYLIAHPTVIVRRPAGQLASVSVGFPGNVAPYNGMNAAGIALASNNNGVNPDLDPNQRGRRGHTQMIHQILASCSDLDELEAFLDAQPHARATIFVASHGPTRSAAVYEMTPSALVARRPGVDGLVYATNHFLDPEMDPLDNEPETPEDSTVCRLRRLEELLPPEGRESLYGDLDPAAAASVLRDRYSPCTQETAPEDAFDTDSSIGTNGAIWSMVFVPEELTLYLAAGEPPVPRHAYVGFDLNELLRADADGIPDPPEIP